MSLPPPCFLLFDLTPGPLPVMPAECQSP
jgi:hypothetical protein